MEENQENSMSDTKEYDLVIIGAGPGGYVAAIRAAQLGMNVALVEKMESLGGTCLNVGCIPSKAILDSSNNFHQLLHGFADHGISVSGARFDGKTMIARKADVVKRLTGGIAGLIKGNKISRISGAGILRTTHPPHSVEVYDNPQSKWDRALGGLGQTPTKSDSELGKSQATATLQAPRVILAVGSDPVELPFLPYDGDKVISSNGALCIEEPPGSMAIIGAGAIGLEMANVWANLGTKVTVIEMMKQILPGWDAQIARGLKKELKGVGVGFLLDNSVSEAKILKNSVKLSLAKDPGELKVDKVLVAVGRRPHLTGAGMAEAGVSLSPDGRRIAVDENYQTNLDGVYAIGDLVPGPMLAHKAEDEAVVAVERMNGIPAHLDYSAMPGVVYTHPEGATVGLSEEALKEQGREYRKGSFNIAANGRAMALGAKAGFVKILADPKTDRVLGAHILSPWASDLISEIVTVMELKGSVEDIARIIHAHPTLPEAVKEAALAVHGRSIHSLR